MQRTHNPSRSRTHAIERKRRRYGARMPEGDSIYKAALRLQPALAGQPLVAMYAPRLIGERPKSGEIITAVEAVGKHLLIRFSGGVTLESHMRMTGSWRVVDLTGPAPRSTAVRVVLDTPTTRAVCFNAPIVRTWRRPDSLQHLGPDLCRLDVDLHAVLERLCAVDESDQIGDVLLDQRLACGIGNVYKSEVLHACRQDPFAALHDLDEARRRELFETAVRLLQANLGPGRRQTVPGGYAVYLKLNRPCPRCRTRITMKRQGEHARSTYYCPSCQKSR